MTKCYDINRREKERFNRKLEEKINEMTIMIINNIENDDSRRELKAQYLHGFKQGLIDAQWIYNNLM